MGKQSTRENKTIYQLYREAAGLTRAEASEKMDAVSDSKIEKFEYETQEPTPYDILQMADAYKRPELCFRHRHCQPDTGHTDQFWKNQYKYNDKEQRTQQ